jgi:hypothetical protein
MHKSGAAMRDQPKYGATEEVLVLLINQSVNGPPEQRLAAKFVLNCLRSFHTKPEISACLDHLECEALLDIAGEARRLASEYHLIN